jgi:GNAT superfamily N-acetyltransferase
MDEKRLYNCLFGKNKLAEVILAEINQIRAGLVVLSETNRNFTLFKKPGMYVHDIYVLPEYRGKGIGKYLGNAIKQLAKERDYGRVDWVVLSDNRLGHEFFSRLPDATKVDYIQCMRINIP